MVTRLVALAMAAAFLRPVALILRRTQPQPTREVLLGGETADVHADLGQDHQGRAHVDPVDQGQVHAQGLEQRARRLEPDVVALAPSLPRLDTVCLLVRPVGEIGQFCFDLLVALGDLPMMELVQLIGLPQLEEMFGPPRSLQRKGYLFLTVLTASSRSWASLTGSRWPSRMAPMIDMPVTPVMSLTTCVSLGERKVKAYPRIQTDPRTVGKTNQRL